MKSKIFEREINEIQSEDFRDFVRFYFDEKVGDWFWKSGASSSGKFHPIFSQGEGGLVRSTKAIVLFCTDFLRLISYSYMKDEFKDFAIMACLLHDTCKYGVNHEVDKTCYKNHGELAANKVSQAWFEFFGAPAPELLCMAIRSHMGQWTENKDHRPFTNLDRLVHLSDYIASRSFIDIPQISEEYNLDTSIDIIEDDLPF